MASIEAITPLALGLAKSGNGRVIRIESPGYHPVEIRMAKKTSGGPVLGNLLFGLLPGLRARHRFIRWPMTRDSSVPGSWPGRPSVRSLSAADAASGAASEFAPQEIDRDAEESRWSAPGRDVPRLHRTISGTSNGSGCARTRSSREPEECRWRESNPHSSCPERDFESRASASSATPAQPDNYRGKEGHYSRTGTRIGDTYRERYMSPISFML